MNSDDIKYYAALFGLSLFGLFFSLAIFLYLINFYSTKPQQKDHPHVAQIAELRDQITQMRQQLIVVTAKFEGKPQSCGVNDWLTFDGRK